MKEAAIAAESVVTLVSMIALNSFPNKIQRREHSNTHIDI